MGIVSDKDGIRRGNLTHTPFMPQAVLTHPEDLPSSDSGRPVAEELRLPNASATWQDSNPLSGVREKRVQLREPGPSTLKPLIKVKERPILARIFG